MKVFYSSFNLVSEYTKHPINVPQYKTYLVVLTVLNTYFPKYKTFTSRSYTNASVRCNCPTWVMVYSLSKVMFFHEYIYTILFLIKIFQFS